VAEWLGSALQKLLQRFESARDLDVFKYTPRFGVGFFVFMWRADACFGVSLRKAKNSEAVHLNYDPGRAQCGS
jgi:hypothetical protein